MVDFSKFKADQAPSINIPRVTAEYARLEAGDGSYLPELQKVARIQAMIDDDLIEYHSYGNGIASFRYTPKGRQALIEKRIANV